LLVRLGKHLAKPHAHDRGEGSRGGLAEATFIAFDHGDLWLIEAPVEEKHAGGHFGLGQLGGLPCPPDSSAVKAQSADSISSASQASGLIERHATSINMRSHIYMRNRRVAAFVTTADEPEVPVGRQNVYLPCPAERFPQPRYSS
jgi:hypothetical protein